MSPFLVIIFNDVFVWNDQCINFNFIHLSHCVFPSSLCVSIITVCFCYHCVLPSSLCVSDGVSLSLLSVFLSGVSNERFRPCKFKKTIFLLHVSIPLLSKWYLSSNRNLKLCLLNVVTHKTTSYHIGLV